MNKTMDQLKYWTRLTASAAYTFVKINIVGGLSTGLAVALMIVLIVQQSFGGGPGPGHVGGAGALAMLFALRPGALITAMIILFVSPVFLIVWGYKYVMVLTSGKLIRDKGEDLLYPLIDKALGRLKRSRPQLMIKGGDALKVKLRLIQEIKESSDSKLAKRITIWGLKSADLNDVNLGAEDLSLSEVIRDRLINALHSFSKPSKLLFYIVLALQWTAVLLTLLKVF